MHESKVARRHNKTVWQRRTPVIWELAGCIGRKLLAPNARERKRETAKVMPERPAAERRLLIANGGRGLSTVQCESKLGEGATFVLRLPAWN